MLRRRPPGSSRRTRVWVTISARRVDPGALLEQAAARAGLAVDEIAAFDGASAAIAPHLPSLPPRHGDGDPLALDDADLRRIDALLRAVHAEPSVQDVLLESHLPRRDDASRVQVIAFRDLLARVADARLQAGVRYISD